MKDKMAILVDGSFIRFKLQQAYRRHIDARDVADVTEKLAEAQRDTHDLYRVFYYDARPYNGNLTHPISGESREFGQTGKASHMRQFFFELESSPFFAMRMGELLPQGWRLNAQAERQLSDTNATLRRDDILPNLKQKGVEMRIGLDVADISCRGLVQALLIITGGADFVSAMKYARRQGLQVMLYAFDQHVSNQLRAHSDLHLPADAIDIAAGDAGHEPSPWQARNV